MAEESTFEVGNASIVLSGPNDLFSDGHTTGYLEFYDERHRPYFPLTSQVIHDSLLMILDEPNCSDLWKARRIAGWMEALMENAPQTFWTVLPLERLTVLQEAYKEEGRRHGKRANECTFPS